MVGCGGTAVGCGGTAVDWDTDGMEEYFAETISQKQTAQIYKKAKAKATLKTF